MEQITAISKIHIILYYYLYIFWMCQICIIKQNYEFMNILWIFGKVSSNILIMFKICHVTNKFMEIKIK